MSRPAKQNIAKQNIAQRIVAQQRALEAGKAGYERANELLEELVHDWPTGQPVRLADGSTAELIDKFANGKNRIGAGLGVNRYEIEVTRARDITSKL